MLDKALYFNSPNIGIFSEANNEVAVVPPEATAKFKKNIGEKLEVKVIETTICNSNLVGVFIAMNDDEVLVPPTATEIEKRKLEKHLEVVEVDTRYTAIGNLVAMNNQNTAVSHLIKKDVEGEPIKIAGSDIIGSSLFVTDEGFLAHRETTKKELKKAKNIFEVEGDIGTVNFGDPYVKTGIIGNNNGLLIGQRTTGPELNRIDEVFLLK